ncbi:MAG: hypothetical protein GY800_07910 [Planctomycetes bacterium]|nr:hypothetical protein [Planctomycetota bacterium]
MPYKRPFRCIKEFASSGKIPASYYIIIFRILFLMFFFSMSTISCSGTTPPDTATAPAPAGWAATYGGGGIDESFSIEQTSDGGYIVAGETESFGTKGKRSSDFLVLKLGHDGTVEWQKSYGGENWDDASSIQQTRDGGYITAGLTRSFEAVHRDLWVLKLGPAGGVEWQKTYGGEGWDEANYIRQTVDGGYIVAGMTKSFGEGEVDAWVLKLRHDGTVEWQKTYGGAFFDQPHSVQQTTDGGYIVAGMTWPPDPEAGRGPGAHDFWVLKLRPDGTVEWQKTYGGNYDDLGSSIHQTADGGYIVAGWTSSYGSGNSNLWVLKLRRDGTIEWQKAYGRKEVGEQAASIRQTADGGYVAAGWTSFISAEKREVRDFLVLKLDPDGTIEWQKTFGADDDERAESIRQTADGGYIVVGWTGTYRAGNKDFLVLKLRPDGSIGPSCDLMKNAGISGKDSSAAARAGTAVVSDTNVRPQNSAATVRDTNVSADILCSSAAAE